ncbi:MAG: polysaccharide biosynthesis tyrosine autokinase, partial [Actinobacteria bacterium]|nr:polysaccharide biosynthesis tyrosine autokinase [Actinomycetota bacterium]
MDEPVDIELLEYVRIIAKRKSLILAGILICLVLAMVVTFKVTPVYEASAKLLVSQRQVVSADQSLGESYQAVLMSEKLAKTFSEMLEGRVAAEAVIKKLDLPITTVALVKRIEAEPIRETQLIKLSIKDTDPKRARLIANTLGEVFSKMVKDIEPASPKPSTYVQVVEPAVEPVDPISPKLVLNAIIALLVGLILSIGLAFLLERLDTSVKSADEVEKLTGMVSLGSIPLTNNKRAVIDNGNNHAVSEAYRSLRTNIQYLNFDNLVKVIVLTSPGLKEGKTTLSANLALILAKAGHGVLVIDCDLRRSRIHEVFGLPNDAGLASVLSGRSDIANTIRKGSVNGLNILTSGIAPPNPAELLGSKHMEEILKSAKEKFDYVILDSPPVLAVTDAAVLASKADGVLLASTFGRTNKQALAASQAALEKIGVRVLGFVINGIKPGGSYNYNY